MAESTIPQRRAEDIITALRNKQEVALIDVREEAPFATAHPLFAANIALSKLEIDLFDRVPHRDTPITLYDNGEGLAEVAAERIRAFGYSDVALLQDGLTGWREAGGEIFIDVNSPSKAFGELVESLNHTPSLPAEEVDALLHDDPNVVVLDARRFDEYHTMSIPRGVSVPGAELVLRVQDLAPSADTTVIVNCAGRTRSIIGAQSLLNAGIPNRVFALRNGTIGWTLAGLELDKGQSRRYGPGSDTARHQAAQQARRVADRSGVQRLTRNGLAAFPANRTVYLFDVRDEAEYQVGHLAGSRSVPGGQLVQETDHYASVRGAIVVLIDDDGVRANMSASWLAQMGWESYVLDGLTAADFSVEGNWSPQVSPPAPFEAISPATLNSWLAEGTTQVLDFTRSASYLAGHIPGAAWLPRSALTEQGEKILPVAQRYVVTCGSSLLARYTVTELRKLSGKPVFVLEGGNLAWRAAGLAIETGATRLLVDTIDRYRRPYEGTDNSTQAMQAYLDWEFGLVAQLKRDATHGFQVLEKA